MGYIGDYLGDYYRAYSGDTMSLDYSSYESYPKLGLPFPGAPIIRVRWGDIGPPPPYRGNYHTSPLQKE